MPAFRKGETWAAGPGQHLVVAGRGLQLLGARVQAGDVRQTTVGQLPAFVGGMVVLEVLALEPVRRV